MPAALERLNGIKSDIDTAFSELLDICHFVADKKAPPEMQVRVNNSVIVSLVSIVEEAVRDMFEDYIEILAAGMPNYQTLPHALKKKNLDCALEELRSLGKSNKDISVVVSRLEKFSDGSTEFSLYSSKMAFNKHGVKCEDVKNIGKDLGVDGFWGAISSSQNVKALYTIEDSGALEQQVRRDWDAILSERDTIVHQYSQASSSSIEKIKSYINFFSAAFGAIAIFLAATADDYVAQRTRPAS